MFLHNYSKPIISNRLSPKAHEGLGLSTRNNQLVSERQNILRFVYPNTNSQNIIPFTSPRYLKPFWLVGLLFVTLPPFGGLFHDLVPDRLYEVVVAGDLGGDDPEVLPVVPVQDTEHGRDLVVDARRQLEVVRVLRVLAGRGALSERNVTSPSTITLLKYSVGSSVKWGEINVEHPGFEPMTLCAHR